MDSTKQVVAEDDVAPPEATARPSTSRTRLIPGKVPSGFVSLASSPTPRIVPIASKKQDSSTVKTNRVPVRKPTLPKPPNRLTWPTSPKSGAATGLPGHCGTVRPQAEAGRSVTSWTTTASTVMATMEIRMAPGVLRISRVRVSSTPSAKISTGQPCRWPPAPSWRGTVVCARSGMRETKPESTRPISMMNRPMPIAMPLRRPSGTAFMTRSRRPVATSSITTK